MIFIFCYFVIFIFSYKLLNSLILNYINAEKNCTNMNSNFSVKPIKIMKKKNI